MQPADGYLANAPADLTYAMSWHNLLASGNHLWVIQQPHFKRRLPFEASSLLIGCGSLKLIHFSKHESQGNQSQTRVTEQFP